MGILLGLGAALAFGLGDFLGGIAAKRVAPMVVSFYNQLVGIPILLLLLLVFPMTRFIPQDMVFGVLAGLFTTVGMVLLYRALSEGLMGVLSVIVAALSAVIPFFFALVAGESLSALAAVGIVLALISVFVVGKGPDDAHALLRYRRQVLIAAGSGTMFAISWIFVISVSQDSGMMPLVVNRITGVLVILPLLHRARLSVRATSSVLVQMVVSGVGAAAGTICFLLGAYIDAVAVVSVLQAMAPLVLALLAARFLAQRLNRLQIFGMALAVAATALLAAS